MTRAAGRVSATCPRCAGTTIAASKPKDGGWSNPNRASLSGIRRPDALTPPHRPAMPPNGDMTGHRHMPLGSYSPLVRLRDLPGPGSCLPPAWCSDALLETDRAWWPPARPGRGQLAPGTRAKYQGVTPVLRSGSRCQPGHNRPVMTTRRESP